MARKRISRKWVVVSNPYFKLLLWINVSLCAITMGTMIAVSFFGPDNLSQQMLFATSEKIFIIERIAK